MSVGDTTPHGPLGKDWARGCSTLMELVPPVGWADVATKRDLSNEIALLEARFGARLEARLNSQTKTLVGVLIASNATLAAIVFAAARLS